MAANPVTPHEFYWGCLYVCGGLLAVAFTLVVLGCAVVAFIGAAGWIASTFKRMETGTAYPGVAPNGLPATVIRFPTGQVGTVPAGSPQPELFT